LIGEKNGPDPYLDPRATGKGLGRALLNQLIETCRLPGFAEMLATVAGDGNHASLGRCTRAVASCLWAC